MALPPDSTSSVVTILASIVGCRWRTDELIRRCYVGLDTQALAREVLQRLRTLAPIDAGFFATVDPATMLFTSAVSEDPLIGVAPMFLANELAGRDVNRFVEVASAS